MNNADIYTHHNGIRQYKFDRLPFSFWHVWSAAPENITKTLYSLTTHMVMGRWHDDEIVKMLAFWHHKRHLKPRFNQIRAIIEAVKAFTIEDRRRQEREWKRSTRAKKKMKMAWLEEQRQQLGTGKEGDTDAQ